VVAGDRLGRRLGWPTVNLRADGQLPPLEGVYATRVEFPGSGDPAGSFDSVTNVGRRPTVSADLPPVVESHILDFDREVYGVRMELFFHKRLRDEMLFPSVAELSAQIGRDVQAGREYFALLRRSHGSTGLGEAIEDR
jgi:riboflavin kinase/FMN adenylyltransferase